MMLPQPSDRFLRLMAGEDQALTLAEAVLEIATIDSSSVDAPAVLRTLDEWAGEIGRRLGPNADGPQFLSAANHYLFGEIGLRGDREDYYSPANSCLDQVVARRRGLPISLAVIYIEVGRRLGRPVAGVGLPAHFVCIYDDDFARVFIDVFDQGRLLTEEDCLDIVEERTGERFAAAPSLFQALPERKIALRVMNNLMGAYERRGDEVKKKLIDFWLRMSKIG